MTSPITPAPRVVLVSRAARGGHPRYCAEVATALAEHGAEVTVLEPAAAFASTELLNHASVDNAPISGPKRGWLVQEVEIAMTFIAERKTVGTAVFHDTSPFRALLIALLRAATSWTPVTMVHNTRPHITSFKERIKHYGAMTALAVPHRVLVHNERQRAELAKNPLVRATSIDIVPHGSWTHTTTPSAVVARRTTLLMFGVMRNNSGLDVLLRAAPAIAREFPDVEIVVAGSPTSPEVEALLAKLDAFDNIAVRAEFIDNDEVASLFRKARFVLLPYVDYSSESGVLMQAVANQIPVITAGATSVADRVRELSLGPDPTGALIDQVREAMNAPPSQYDEWRSNLAAAAQANTWSTHAAIVLDANATAQISE